MPVAEQSKIFTNFTGGLNTEATGLNFPENAAVELDNFDLFRTGEVKRRLGLDFESAYSLSTASFPTDSLETNAVSTHEWKSVNGNGELNFLVVQIGLTLYIHDLGLDPVSGTLLGTVDLEPLRVGSNAETFLIDSSFGEGRMMIASREIEPAYIEYDEDDGSFTLVQINLLIRDFDGVEDQLDVGERPTSLSDEHYYNLLNQGWPTELLTSNSAGGGSGITLRDPVQYTFDELGVYPSNADIVHLGKLGISADPAPLGTYHPTVLQKLTLGNTPAPKGHFIFSPWNRDRNNIVLNAEGNNYFIDVPLPFGLSVTLPTGTTSLTFGGLPAEVDLTRPTATEFYANRVWYAGAVGESNAGDIFFSQVLTDMSKAGKCYQEADPTAEESNSLVDTDGGVIHIAGIGRIQRMIAIGQDLVIVASNGTWAISGADGGNFRATNFTVRKINDIGTLSSESIVEAEGLILMWNQGGIYLLQSGQINDELTVTRLTEDTIQTFYDDISNAARAYVRGFYDDFNKKVYWFYNSSASYDGITNRFNYNRALVFDLTLNAFYPFTFGELASNSPVVAAMVQKQPGTEAAQTYDIVLGPDDIVLSGDDIVQDVAFPSFSDTKLKLLTFVQDLSDSTVNRYTFSEFSSRDFRDWETWDIEVNGPGSTGINYDSVLQAGWQHFGDPLPLKKITHVTSYFNRTEDGYQLVDGDIVFTNPSGGTVQTRWQWTDVDIGRWTKEETVYRLNRNYIPDDENDPFDYGFTIIKTKLAMRGKGNAFGIRYKSEEGKDMQLIGFGVNLRAGTKL